VQAEQRDLVDHRVRGDVIDRAVLGRQRGDRGKGCSSDRGMALFVDGRDGDLGELGDQLALGVLLPRGCMLSHRSRRRDRSAFLLSTGLAPGPLKGS
jgi:hypothetical protein